MNANKDRHRLNTNQQAPRGNVRNNNSNGVGLNLQIAGNKNTNCIRIIKQVTKTTLGNPKRLRTDSIKESVKFSSVLAVKDVVHGHILPNLFERVLTYSENESPSYNSKNTKVANLLCLMNFARSCKISLELVIDYIRIIANEYDRNSVLFNERINIMNSEGMSLLLLKSFGHNHPYSQLVIKNYLFYQELEFVNKFDGFSKQQEDDFSNITLKNFKRILNVLNVKITEVLNMDQFCVQIVNNPNYKKQCMQIKHLGMLARNRFFETQPAIFGQIIKYALTINPSQQRLTAYYLIKMVIDFAKARLLDNPVINDHLFSMVVKILTDRIYHINNEMLQLVVLEMISTFANQSLLNITNPHVQDAIAHIFSMAEESTINGLVDPDPNCIKTLHDLFKAGLLQGNNYFYPNLNKSVSLAFDNAIAQFIDVKVYKSKLTKEDQDAIDKDTIEKLTHFDSVLKTLNSNNDKKASTINELLGKMHLSYRYVKLLGSIMTMNMLNTNDSCIFLEAFAKIKKYALDIHVDKSSTMRSIGMAEIITDFLNAGLLNDLPTDEIIKIFQHFLEFGSKIISEELRIAALGMLNATVISKKLTLSNAEKESIQQHAKKFLNNKADSIKTICRTILAELNKNKL